MTNAVTETEQASMRLALTMWNGRISPVLDVTRRVWMVDVEQGKVVRQREEVLPGDTPFRQATRLAELAPDVLICGAVSRVMASALEAQAIPVVPFVSGTADEVLAAWQAGKLPNAALSMPGCRRRVRRCPGGGRGRGKGRGGMREAREMMPEYGRETNE